MEAGGRETRAKIGVERSGAEGRCCQPGIGPVFESSLDPFGVCGEESPVADEDTRGVPKARSREVEVGASNGGEVKGSVRARMWI